MAAQVWNVPNLLSARDQGDGLDEFQTGEAAVVPRPEALLQYSSDTARVACSGPKVAQDEMRGVCVEASAKHDPH